MDSGFRQYDALIVNDECVQFTVSYIEIFNDSGESRGYGVLFDDHEPKQMLFGIENPAGEEYFVPGLWYIGQSENGDIFA